jgi:hypothetical protein
MEPPVSSTQKDVAVAAIEWWRMKLPTGWDHEQHLDNPTINCIGEFERKLAAAVAEYLDDRE